MRSLQVKNVVAVAGNNCCRHRQCRRYRGLTFHCRCWRHCRHSRCCCRCHEHQELKHVGAVFHGRQRSRETICRHSRHFVNRNLVTSQEFCLDNKKLEEVALACSSHPTPHKTGTFVRVDKKHKWNFMSPGLGWSEIETSSIVVSCRLYQGSASMWS